jgi:hypothetical protein
LTCVEWNFVCQKRGEKERGRNGNQ